MAPIIEIITKEQLNLSKINNLLRLAKWLHVYVDPTSSKKTLVKAIWYVLKREQNK